MKRYYICKVIGDGLTPESSLRSPIENVIDPITGAKAFGSVSVIATDPITGQPVHPWTLTVAVGQKHGLLSNHPDVDPLPDYPFDAKLSAMHLPTKTQMIEKMQLRGIDTGFITNADGFRDVIRTLGRRHVADFDENNFDVPG